MNTKLSTSPRLLLIALVASLSFFAACSDDCDNLRKDVDDLRQRVEKLEDWCSSANSQISALQGLVEALEANDYVTAVSPIMEGTLETGYTIQFSKSGPVTIRHGKDGKDGLTPLIGAASDTDGRYYWTVTTGAGADPQWLTDADGNKIPTTGKDGADGTNAQPPAISVDTYQGALYWKINGQWLLDNNHAKVPATGPQGPEGSQGATGPQGDAVFAPRGVTVNDAEGYVTFTLADNTTTFRLPLLASFTIGPAGNDPVNITPGIATSIPIHLPATLTESSYSALMAEVVPEAGNVDIVTRGTATDWKVELELFEADGTPAKQPAVQITPPADTPNNTKALLRITLINSDGNETTATRVLLVPDNIFYDYTLEKQKSESGAKPKKGDGSAGNPYLIETKEHLQWIKKNPTEAHHYKLMKDIQVTGTEADGNWKPIGNTKNNMSYLFQGHFDGNGKNVSGIVAEAGWRHFGFFGDCERAEIRNLNYTGAMDLSNLNDETICIGAIAGLMGAGSIEHCSNSADLTCEKASISGGIVGQMYEGRIEACENTGNIVAAGAAGGIVGELSNQASMVGCINKGDRVETTSDYGLSGGIAGWFNGYATACWNRAEPISNGSNKPGGIAGIVYNNSTSAFTACYWRAIANIEGIGGYGNNAQATTTSFEPFSGDRPGTDEIQEMNEAWEKVNPSRKYRFNATGDIEPIGQP